MFCLVLCLHWGVGLLFGVRDFCPDWGVGFLPGLGCDILPGLGCALGGLPFACIGVWDLLFHVARLGMGVCIGRQ